MMDFNCIEPLLEYNPSPINLTYKYYYNGDTDIKVSLNTNGYISISTGSWFYNSENVKTFNFTIEKEAVFEVINSFKQTYSKSEDHDIDDILTSHYAIIELSNESTNESTTISYYNQIPNEEFELVKDKILNLGLDAFNGL